MISFMTLPPCARTLLFLMVAVAAMGLEQPPLSELFRASEDQPIECHVRFIDQDGKAVAGVPIKAHIWTGNADGSIAATKNLAGLTTDASGLVSVGNERGGFLRLTVDDDKYTHGFYGPQALPGVVLRFSKVGGNGSLRHGTVKDPAEYFVWRREGSQPLVALSGELKLDYKQGEIRVDLLTGELVDVGGDVVIGVQVAESESDRKKAADHRGYFPHAVSLNVIGGGLASIDASVDSSDYDAIPGVWSRMFPTILLEGTSSLSYQAGKDVGFIGYVRTRDGKVQGKVRLSVGMERYWRSERGRLIIRVDALLNTSGSRSLEPDPAKLTRLTLTDARKKPGTEPKKP